MRKYKCGQCKEDSFKTRFKLTEHLKRCKKGLLVAGKDGKVRCPECKGKVSYLGLGSHRFSTHGVKGTSRWARKSQRQKAAKESNKSAVNCGVTITDIANSIPVKTWNISKQTVNDNASIAKSLMDQAAQHRNQAASHLTSAERLTKMAAELKELSS